MRLRRLGGLALICGLVIAGGYPREIYGNTSEIPWNNNIIFERTSVDESIQAILTTITRLNGFKAIFKPGITGTITYRFKNIPLAGAFNMITELNNIRYEFDKTKRTLIFFGPSDLVDGKTPSEIQQINDMIASMNKETQPKVDKKAAARSKVHEAQLNAARAEIENARIKSERVIAKTQREIQDQERSVKRITLITRQIAERQTLQQKKLLTELNLRQLQQSNAEPSQIRRTTMQTKHFARKLRELERRHLKELELLASTVSYPTEPTPEAERHTQRKLWTRPLSREDKEATRVPLTPKPILAPRSEENPQIILRNISDRYKLSGIGKYDNEYYANINGAEYKIGDILDGLTVALIGRYEVKLTKSDESGVIYLIRFRQKPN